MVVEQMRSEAKKYAQRFDGEPYLSQTEIDETINNAKADLEDVYTAADELMDFYDDLLDVDTADVREEFKDDILYDMSVREMLSPRLDKQTAKIFGSGLVAPAAAAIMEPSMAEEVLVASTLLCEYFNTKGTVSNAEAGYNPFSQKIGVSRDTLQERKAYDNLASELLHRYQHHFDSETWMDVNRSSEVDPVTEGFERASKIEALDHFDQIGFRGLNWQELHDMRRASTAINGYAQALSEISDISVDDMVDLGLSESKASEAVENVGTDSSRGYDLLAASLLARGKDSDSTYSEVFHGDFRQVPGFVEAE